MKSKGYRQQQKV